LFIAGVIPGLMLAFALGADDVLSRLEERLSAAAESLVGERRFETLSRELLGLLLIVIVIGGIYSGAFTPTEAAAVSAVYAFIVAVFVYKDMGLADVPRVLLSSANMSAMLLYIITNAVLFSFLMTHENIPQADGGWIAETGLGWIGFLFLVNICCCSPAM
jgi:C4-dicarboxylate transporter DctM subunit